MEATSRKFVSGKQGSVRCMETRPSFHLRRTSNSDEGLIKRKEEVLRVQETSGVRLLVKIEENDDRN